MVDKELVRGLLGFSALLIAAAFFVHLLAGGIGRRDPSPQEKGTETPNQSEMSGHASGAAENEQLAGGGDPYSNQQRNFSQDRYRRILELFLINVETASFAANCSVLREVSATVLVRTYENELGNQIIGMGLNGIQDGSLAKDEQAAVQRGQSQAAKGCQFWQNNPDAVSTIRRAASLAEMMP